MLFKVWKDEKEHDLPYSDAGLICSIRQRLIEFLAGNMCVMLNIRLTIEEREDNQFFAKAKDIDGFLVVNNSFCVPDEQQITFEQVK